MIWQHNIFSKPAHAGAPESLKKLIDKFIICTADLEFSEVCMEDELAEKDANKAQAELDDNESVSTYLKIVFAARVLDYDIREFDEKSAKFMIFCTFFLCHFL